MLQQYLDNIIELRNEKVVVFDWNAYIHKHGDMLRSNILTRKEVIRHLIQHGQYEHKRTLLDTNGNTYYHVFKKKSYEIYIKNVFNTEEDAYIHFCDNHMNITFTCEKLFIKKKYLDVYENTDKLIDVLRRIGKYNTIYEVYKNEEKNTSFSELCEQIYNNYHKINTKSILDSNRISSNSITMEENGINMDKLENIKDDDMNNIKKNIHRFNEGIKKYKNILFICGDYPGYGGAATNCYELQKYFKSLKHNTFGFYFNYEKGVNAKYEKYEDYIIDDMDKCKSIDFKPDIIILKSPLSINLKTIFKCPIYYLIGGIYTNSLDKYYYELKTKEENDKYINNAVLEQIKNCDNTFTNSQHTADILKKVYGITVNIFYSSFVSFLNKKIEVDVNFDERKYNYGLIVSNFERKIKNVEKGIDFLKGKENVILIGKGSLKYKDLGFTCLDLTDNNEMEKYYKQIKYIVQDSFYESCSNVKIEGLFNGCKMNKIYNIVVSSTQYPGYGGAATNAYQIIKFLRQNGYNTVGVFFHDTIKDVNNDPENIGGVFLYDFRKYDENKIRNDVKSYLKVEPNYCLAKNYKAPYICKEIFKCYTVYLVSGINHFSHYVGKSSEDVLNKGFSIDFKIPEEIKCNTLCDKIVINSKLSYDIFNKIYPTFQNKIYPSIVDTTNCINKPCKFINNYKEFDIVISCSRLDRVDKNNLFLINILKNPKYDKYKKMIIGNNFDKFIDIPNTQCVGLCEQIQCIEYMSKSKVLLFPSLFDANSNTIREAIYYKCLPLITKNIGFYEVFPDFLISNSYTIEEWDTKLLYILENYSNVKDTQFNFNTGENIIDFLEKN